MCRKPQSDSECAEVDKNFPFYDEISGVCVATEGPCEPDEFVAENNTCVDECDNFGNLETMRCVDGCGEIHFTENRTCIDNCSEYGFVADLTDKECLVRCAAGQVNESGKCSCPPS